MTPQQAKILQQIARAVIESIDAAGKLGASGGVLYSALMSAGCTLAQYEQIMAGLVTAKMVEKHGECYTATDKDRTFAHLKVPA